MVIDGQLGGSKTGVQPDIRAAAGDASSPSIKMAATVGSAVERLIFTFSLVTTTQNRYSRARGLNKF